MTQTYPSTRYLQQLTVANGWRPELIPDRHGRPLAVVVVRVGPRGGARSPRTWIRRRRPGWPSCDRDRH